MPRYQYKYVGRLVGVNREVENTKEMMKEIRRELGILEESEKDVLEKKEELDTSNIRTNSGTCSL